MGFQDKASRCRPRAHTSFTVMFPHRVCIEFNCACAGPDGVSCLLAPFGPTLGPFLVAFGFLWCHLAAECLFWCVDSGTLVLGGPLSASIERGGALLSLASGA